MLTIARVAVRGPAIEGNGNGTVAFLDDVTSDFNYDLTRVELEQLPSIVGEGVHGTLSTKGRLNGPWSAMRAAGDASIAHLDALDVDALTMSGQYDVTVPSGDAAHASGRVAGRGEFLTVAGQALQEAEIAARTEADMRQLRVNPLAESRVVKDVHIV